MLFFFSFFKSPLGFSPIHIREIPKLNLSEKDSLWVGYSSFSLLMDGGQNLGGYGNRGAFEHVLDTPYFHLLFVQVAGQKLLIASADLLIFPPELYNFIKQKADSLQYGLYLGASHSHHSVGGWAQGVGAAAMTGHYYARQVDMWKEKLERGIREVTDKKQKAAYAVSKFPVAQHVIHRLSHDSAPWDTFQSLNFMLADSSIIMLSSYGAHPTSIPGSELVLSNDYPAFYSRKLKENPHIKAVVFMAGAVGSQGPRLTNGKSVEAAKQIGESLAEKATDNLHSNEGWKHTAIMGAQEISLQLPKPSPRVTNSLYLRPWVFDQLMGKSNQPMQIMQLDNYLYLSYPIDFSGDLAAEITTATSEVNLITNFTSFSGGYYGYVVNDYHYEHTTRAECRDMNWAGPYAAQYLKELSIAIIKKQQDLPFTY